MTRRSATMTAVALLAASSSTLAAGTRLWEVRTAAQFSEGKLDGAIVVAGGTVRAGWATSRHELTADAVWCVLPDLDGGAYIGTGSKGELYKLSEENVSLVAETKQTAITVMKRVPRGVLVGTIPEGRIFLLDQAGKLSEFIKIDAKYIWDIAVIPDGTIYVATGPDGKLFRIKNRKAEVWFKSKDPNLLSLSIAPDGTVYAGSSEKGLLYRITDKDSATVAYDFAENEVRSIVSRDDYFLIGANAAKNKGGSTSKPDGDEGEEEATKTKSAPPPSKEPMDCAVYRLSPDGNVESVFAAKGEFIWNMKSLADGTFLVATGESGKVYRGRLPDANGQPMVEGEGSDVIFDLDEGQALALGAEFGNLTMIGTGNGASVYTVTPAIAGKGIYTSKVLDAKHVSTWGRAEWDGRGVVTVETRSGATAEPDDTWHSWTPVDPDRPAVKSPRARYLQFRADVSERGANLQAVRVAYLPANQRPRILSAGLAAAPKKAPKDAKKGNGSRPLPTHQTMTMIKWGAKDPDGDSLLFRLQYRLVEETNDEFKQMNSGEPVRGDKYAWQTRGLPDGRYIVRVTASDELGNSTSRRRATARDTEPLLIDHTPPKVDNVVIAGRIVTGTAVDKASTISHLSWLVDGGDSRLLESEDGLLDSKKESFRFLLPDSLSKGRHALAIQCADKGGNLTVVRVSFDVE